MASTTLKPEVTVCWGLKWTRHILRSMKDLLCWSNRFRRMCPTSRPGCNVTFTLNCGQKTPWWVLFFRSYDQKTLLNVFECSKPYCVFTLGSVVYREFWGTSSSEAGSFFNCNSGEFLCSHFNIYGFRLISVVLTLLFVLVILQTVDIHVNNTSMDTLTVTNPSDNIFNVDYADISGCRYSGQ